MKPQKVALFITVDLATLLIVLLALSYYGMSHLLLLLLGLIVMIMALYDLQSGLLSAFFSDFLGLENPSELGRFRWLPVILAAILLMLSLPALFNHGLVNEGQRWAMQHGQFIRVALPASLGGLAIIAIAVGTIISGSNKKK